MPDKVCGICCRSYTNLKQHLRVKHTVPNIEEVRLLVKWGNARTTAGLVCPICCSSSVFRLDRHLALVHKHLLPEEREWYVTEAKRAAIEEELKALRATDPHPPMMSSLGMLDEFSCGGTDPLGKRVASVPVADEPRPSDAGSLEGSLSSGQPTFVDSTSAPLPRAEATSPSWGVSSCKCMCSCHAQMLEEIIARVERLERILAQQGLLPDQEPQLHCPQRPAASRMPPSVTWEPPQARNQEARPPSFSRTRKRATETNADAPPVPKRRSVLDTETPSDGPQSIPGTCRRYFRWVTVRLERLPSTSRLLKPKVSSSREKKDLQNTPKPEPRLSSPETQTSLEES
ncbi:uncharacterized protein LOC112159986 isoform X2 [Oryzias melastigma]|uniref:uncharacterized protein LOC112159986 isoform X2 n=1 Tax=Oryzias melastigma TaxID=30732 RepID=UPI000CF80107|nr:uncharacterized protein LOC112159986 isoform X2 [Oryzias melastigma]